MSNQEEERIEKSNDICRDFLRNVCNRGNACKYLHKREESEEGPQFCKDFLKNGCFRSNCKYLHCTEEEYKAKTIPICKDFLQGKCNRGRSCKYLHRMGAQNPDMPPFRNGMPPPYVNPPYPGSPPPPPHYENELHSELRRLKYENDLLLRDNEELKRKNDDLNRENDFLSKENAQLRREKESRYNWSSNYSSHIAPELVRGSTPRKEMLESPPANQPLISYPIKTKPAITTSTLPYERYKPY